MDFKGITWVGNVYNKFEAMCLEVEELIVQDTAKYVESQVHTVGNSMKKFCSDVVQDLLPDDSVASEKTLHVSMLHEYAPVCSFKKKRESFSGKTRDVKQEQEVTGGKKNGCEMNFDADDYGISTSPKQCSYGGPYRRTRPGREQILKKEEIVQVTRPSIEKDLTSLSIVHTTRLKNDAGAVKSTDSPPGEVARLNSKEECQNDVRTENEHFLMVTDSVRSQDSVIQPSVAISLSAGSDACIYSDCRKETDEDPMQTEHKSEILSGRPIEESCIVVDRDELHCVFADRKENDKHKPYKKIRDAISSRMKQNREKEYKRLARQWYAEDVVNGRECGDNPKQIEENQSSEESEWELL